MVEFDDVDWDILHELQVDVRNTTAQEIADKVGASASTVRNRIARLEHEDIIEGYHLNLNYEHANLPLQFLFVCTADPDERTEIVEHILDIHGVVNAREMLTGRRNLYIEVIGTSTADVSRITDAIHELGLAVESSEMIRQRRVQPFNHPTLTPHDESAAE